VDERVGMDALDGAGQRQGVGFAPAAGGSRREAKRGAHPLTAGKERIAHGFVMVTGRVLSLGRNLSSAALTVLVRVARNCCKSNWVFADMTVCFRKRPQPAQV